MVDGEDFFSENLQKKARISGKYEEIAKNVGKCVFCDLRDKYIIMRLKKWVLTVNIYPYIDGQLLILPERHIENYSDLTPDDKLTSDKLIKKGMELLKKEMHIENYWVILRQGKVSGKTVMHLHWNIIPYKEGLNTWHYQKIKIKPLSLAKKLKRAIRK